MHKAQRSRVAFAANHRRSLYLLIEPNAPIEWLSSMLTLPQIACYVWRAGMV